MNPCCNNFFALLDRLSEYSDDICAVNRNHVMEIYREMDIIIQELIDGYRNSFYDREDLIENVEILIYEWSDTTDADPAIIFTPILNELNLDINTHMDLIDYEENEEREFYNWHSIL